MMSADKEMAVAPDYKAEAECLSLECNRLAGENAKLEEELLIARKTIEEQRSEVDYYAGQVKAFEFCVSRGMFGE